MVNPHSDHHRCNDSRFCHVLITPKLSFLNHALGSGMIESACKWLIQQRFKGVGMRWSEDGFNRLLYLRLDWVKQRFDSLFPHVSKGQIDPSHNR